MLQQEDNKVSIIVPVYNTKEWLEDCVNSLLTQTYRNIEIILVDDGSGDGSGELCDSFVKKDNRVVVLHQKNSGVSVARNNALDKATGEYVMFCDSDDIVAPQWVEMHVAAQKKYPNCSISSQVERFHDCINVEEYSEINVERIDYWTLFISGHSGYPVNKIFSKTIIDKYHLRFEIGVPIGEDVAYVSNYMSHCEGYYFISNLLYYYRQIGSSALHKYNSRQLEYMLKAFYARVPLVAEKDLTKYCDHWLCEFIRLLNNVFDEKNKTSFLSKVCYNRGMLASEEMKFCLRNASGKNENKIILFLVRHNLPLIYRVMQIGYKTFSK